MEEKKLEELFMKLTLEQKIGQLVQLSGSFFKGKGNVSTGPISKIGLEEKQVYEIGSVLNSMGAKELIDIQNQYLSHSEHKIPLLFMADIINGFKTIFPISLGLGCTFHPELIKKTAQVAAKEAAISGIHVTFSPMIDMVRDARWGRVMETYGEDTYLNCLYAKAMVEGYQGDNNPSSTIASCVKHFAGYGGCVAGKDYNTVELSERTLRQDYLPAYQAAIEAGCKLMMTSFNTINGIPVTANKKLLKDVLRNEWGFNGVVISDHSAIKELIPHGIAKDLKEAAKFAMHAGCDIDMMTSSYANNLKELFDQGEVDIKEINEASWRVLQLKNDLGLFENPYRGADIKEENRYIMCEEFRALAREVVSQSIVLLKNEDALPLHKDVKIAVVGPYACTKDLSGMWSFNVDPEKVVTILEGLKKQGTDVQYSKGSPITDEKGLFESFSKQIKPEQLTSIDTGKECREAIDCAKGVDVIIVAIGEHPQQSGEGGSRGDLTIPQVQMRLLHEMKTLGKKVITLVFSGRPLALKEVADYSDAVLQCWFPGTEGGDGIADIIFGTVNPSARLSMTFPYSVGQCPIYYNHHNTGRPAGTSAHSKRFTSRYIDIPNDPFYCFGYGLSYSDFIYSEITLNKNKLHANDVIEASVLVTNNSEISGIETVQLYVRDLIGSIVRPIKELKGIKKVYLQAHETKKVTFTIDESMLRFYTINDVFESENGEFEVYIGHDSSTLDKENFVLIKNDRVGVCCYK